MGVTANPYLTGQRGKTTLQVLNRTVALANTNLVNIGGGAIRPFGSIGSTIYGFNNGGDVLFSSTDLGSNWTQVAGITLGNPVGGSGNCRSIHLCPDGEVLVLRDSNLVKSVGWGGGSPTWANKATISTVTGATQSQFKEWGIDFRGYYGILTEYHNTWGSLSSASNVWITTDGGDTWSVELATGTSPFLDYATHWHGVCIDQWQRRFYVSMGHGDEVGLYVRDFDDSTWYPVDIEPHKLDTLRSTSASMALYSCFTQMCATPRGIYLGTDDFPSAIVEVRSNQATASQRGEVIYIDDELDLMPWWIECGLYHPSSGAVLLGTKLTPSVTTQEPRVYGCIDGKASLIWEYPNDPGTNSNVSIRTIIDAGDGNVLIVVQLNTDFWTLSADVVVS
jgi:hypothetical protein